MRIAGGAFHQGGALCFCAEPRKGLNLLSSTFCFPVQGGPVTPDLPHPIYAAITGDVVRSSRLGPAARERVLAALRSGARAIKAVCPCGLVGGIHL